MLRRALARSCHARSVAFLTAVESFGTVWAGGRGRRTSITRKLRRSDLVKRRRRASSPIPTRTPRPTSSRKEASFFCSYCCSGCHGGGGGGGMCPAADQRHLGLRRRRRHAVPAGDARQRSNCRSKATRASGVKMSSGRCRRSAASSRMPTICGRSSRSCDRNTTAIRPINSARRNRSNAPAGAQAVLGSWCSCLLQCRLQRRKWTRLARSIVKCDHDSGRLAEVRTQANRGCLNENLATSHASRIIHVVESGFQPAGIEPHVTRSWHRCLREYGIEPSAPRHNAILNPQSVKELQQRMGELLPIARAEMESLYEQIAGSGFAVILSDTQGRCSAPSRDPALQREFRQAGLSLGALWDERHEGTNGIGTCLAEGNSGDRASARSISAATTCRFPAPPRRSSIRTARSSRCSMHPPPTRATAA